MYKGACGIEESHQKPGLWNTHGCIRFVFRNSSRYASKPEKLSLTLIQCEVPAFSNSYSMCESKRLPISQVAPLSQAWHFTAESQLKELRNSEIPCVQRWGKRHSLLIYYFGVNLLLEIISLIGKQVSSTVMATLMPTAKAQLLGPGNLETTSSLTLSDSSRLRSVSPPSSVSLCLTHEIWEAERCSEMSEIPEPNNWA